MKLILGIDIYIVYRYRFICTYRRRIDIVDLYVCVSTCVRCC